MRFIISSKCQDDETLNRFLLARMGGFSLQGSDTSTELFRHRRRKGKEKRSRHVHSTGGWKKVVGKFSFSFAPVVLSSKAVGENRASRPEN